MSSIQGGGLTTRFSSFFFIENYQEALKHKINTYFFSIYEGGLACLGLRKFPLEIRN